MVVVARTDATDEDEILRRAAALSATDADVLLVDGVRSEQRIEQARRVIGDKPLLFNQIGERSRSTPELSRAAHRTGRTLLVVSRTSIAVATALAVAGEPS
jgi:2-methylisocitrate lyase-like PEP mutase family enzyme